MGKRLYGDGGDFSDSDPMTIVTPADQAAAEFLLAVNQVEPQVVESLKKRIPPSLLPESFLIFCKRREFADRLAALLEERYAPPPSIPDVLAARLKQCGLSASKNALEPAADERLFLGLASEIKTEIDALAGWMDEHRLHSRPVLRLVVETLADWKYHSIKGIDVDAGPWGVWIDYLADPDRDNKDWDLRILRSGVQASLPSRHRFKFFIEDEWDPFQETRTKAERRIRHRFEDRLKDYLDKEREPSFREPRTKAKRRIKNVFEERLKEYLDMAERVASAMGDPSPEKRDSGDHFILLARFQLNPVLQYKMIAADVGKDRKTVSEGIESTARLLDLNLRRAKRTGRPPGIVESKPRHRVEK